MGPEYRGRCSWEHERADMKMTSKYHSAMCTRVNIPALVIVCQCFEHMYIHASTGIM